MADEVQKITRALARVCVRRMAHLYGEERLTRLTKRLKEQRDTSTVEFMAGAWSMAVVEHGEESPLAKHIGTVTCLLAAVRGYSEIAKLAAEEDTPADPVAEMIHVVDLRGVRG